MKAPLLDAAVARAVLLAGATACVAVAAEPPEETSAINPFASYTLDGLRVFHGGLSGGETLAGLVDFGATVDLARLWQGGRGELLVHGLYFHGDDPSAELVGDFAYLDNIVASGGVRLYQLVYQWEDDAGGFRVGLTSVDEDFGSCETAALFINSAFGPIQTLSVNSGLAIWPLNALGTVVHRHVGQGGFVRAGVYDGVAEPEEGSNRGTRHHLNAKDGFLAHVDLGHTWGSSDTPGAASLGGWWHTGRTERHGDGQTVRGNYGLHVTLEQALDRDGAWRGFARAGYSPRQDRSYVRLQFDTGVVATGQWFGREEDQIGFGLFHTSFSDDYVRTRRSAGDAVAATETGLELTYSLSLGRGVTLQPDLQYLFSPHEGGDDALVGILRFYVEL